jgi:hypothetical protein
MLVLKQGPAGQQQPPQQLQQQQQQELSDVQGIQEAIWSVVNHQAGGNGRELLVNRDLIREVSVDLPEVALQVGRTLL